MKRILLIGLTLGALGAPAGAADMAPLLLSAPGLPGRACHPIFQLDRVLHRCRCRRGLEQPGRFQHRAADCGSGGGNRHHQRQQRDRRRLSRV